MGEILSDENLRFDLKTRALISDFIPLSYFFIHTKCDDEAILSKHLRKNSELIVSEDGRSVKRKFKLKDYTQEDQRCIYIQPFNEKAFEEYNIESTVNKGNYGFIMFRSKQVVDTILVKDHGVKVLSKIEWNSKMDIYHKEYEQFKKDQKAAMESQIGAHKSVFKQGVVKYYENINHESDTKTIKTLFELFSKVSFVDARSHGSGYVRFKTKRGADIAREYFERVCVVQKNQWCTGVLSVDDYHCDRVLNGTAKGICLYNMTEEEEIEYWDTYIFQKTDQDFIVSDEQSFSKYVDSSLKTPSHVIFEEIEEINGSQKILEASQGEKPRKARKRKHPPN